MALPSELVELAIQQLEPFPEPVRSESDSRQHLAGGKVHPAYRGAAEEAGTLVEDAVPVDQALRVGRGVVREPADDREVGKRRPRSTRKQREGDHCPDPSQAEPQWLI